VIITEIRDLGPLWPIFNHIVNVSLKNHL